MKKTFLFLSLILCSFCGYTQQTERLSKSEIEANETPRAVAYNFAMSIINKDYQRMFELATPEYKDMVKEMLRENNATVEQYFSGEFFKSDVVGMRYVMAMGGYEVAVADVHSIDLTPLFQDEPNPFEGLPVICVDLVCVDAENHPYDDSKGDYDADTNVILVKKDAVWRVFTFK